MATTKTDRTSASARKQKVSPKPLAASLPPTNGNGLSPSNGDVLRKLYASVLKCRIVQQHFQRLWAAGDAVPDYELALGHEAVVAGATFDLRDGDTIAASSRNLAAHIARGTPLRQLLGKGRGSDACGCIQNNSVSLPADPFLAGSGIALMHKFEKKQNVVVAICGEELPTLDRWHEAMKFAGTHKLPVIFVVKNGMANGAASAPQNGHLEEVSFMAVDLGFPGVVVDGSDVVAVWRVAQESIHRARNGSGPTLIDCRAESTDDPLAHMEHYLRKRSVWDDDWRSKLTEQLEAELKEA